MIDMNMNYSSFLKTKPLIYEYQGITDFDINSKLFLYQKDIVTWALRKGRACVFADCGMGKTFMQLEWARNVLEFTEKSVIILAPLAVSLQTIEEATRLNINVKHYSDRKESGIYIINYENLHKIDASDIGGIVLDESSIIKNFSGKIRKQIMKIFAHVSYKLACTATPSPNDFMELGNHAEFVGAMSREEMLSMFFVHDGGETSKWRIKSHAKKDFWRWVASWAVMLTKPSDLGYSDDGFELPAIQYIQHIVGNNTNTGEFLFPVQANTLQERIKARSATIDIRSRKCADIVNNIDESFLIWCDRNGESTTIKKLVNDCIEITGSDKPEKKEKTLLDFAHGSIKKIVTKPKIAGFGMNWQICHNMAFVGLSDSYEQFYQATRRCWRFGQNHPVNVHIIISEMEGNVLANIIRKESQAQEMRNMMLENMVDFQNEEIHATRRNITDYLPTQQFILPRF